MNPSVAHCASLLLSVATLLGSAHGQDPAASREGAALLGQLPPRIVPNQGQWQTPERFRMQLPGMHVFLETRGWSFWLQEGTAAGDGACRRHGPRTEAAPQRAVPVRMEFAAAGTPVLTPEMPLAGVSNYLIGAAAQHRTGVPGYGAVLYERMYPGVDVRFREAAGHCEYDLLLAPGADLDQVRVRVTGAETMTVDAEGALVLRTALGEVRQPQPATWMVTREGRKCPVACRYVLLGDDCFGFATADRDPSLPLVVDPPILYSTYVGGAGTEFPWQLIEIAGDILLCGWTQSTTLPFVPATGVLSGTSAGGRDGFLLRLNPQAQPQVVFATWFGGSGADGIYSVASLPGGLIAFGGITSSTDLPVTGGARQGSNAGGNDGFVAVCTGNGATLIASTYFGGTGNDEVGSVNAGPGGSLLVAGITTSVGLPVTGTARFPSHQGGANMRDGFVLQYDLVLSTLAYCSYFGGNGDEWLYSWDVDAAGVMTMVLGTTTTNFPVTATACQPVHHGGGVTWVQSEGLIVRFDPSLPPASQIVYATYLGGSTNDYAYIARTDANGHIIVSGTTDSTDFPVTPGAWQPSYAGGTTAAGDVGDGFLVKIDPTRPGPAGLLFATYFGGTGEDQGSDFTFDPNGEITLVGWTNPTGNNLPTTPDAMRRTYQANDGYVARFSGDGRLLYSSLFGGVGHDGAWYVARHADGVVTVAGQSYSSSGMPVSGNAMQPGYAGNGDAWLVRLQLVPSATLRRGLPTSGSNGRPTIHAIADAVSGSPQFGLACSRAPLNRAGFLILSWLPGTGTPLFGVNAFVDMGSIALSTLVLSDAAGECRYSMPIPVMVVPTFHAQFAWLESPSPMTLSASDAMRIN